MLHCTALNYLKTVLSYLVHIRVSSSFRPSIYFRAVTSAFSADPALVLLDLVKSPSLLISGSGGLLGFTRFRKNKILSSTCRHVYSPRLYAKSETSFQSSRGQQGKRECLFTTVLQFCKQPMKTSINTLSRKRKLQLRTYID